MLRRVLGRFRVMIDVHSILFYDPFFFSLLRCCLVSAADVYLFF